MDNSLEICLALFTLNSAQYIFITISKKLPLALTYISYLHIQLLQSLTNKLL